MWSFYSWLQENQSAVDYFEPATLNHAKNQNYKSREKLIYMSVDDFLNMAAQLNTPEKEKEENIKQITSAGIKLNSMPHLAFVHDGNGVAKVVGHEGRHRALFFKKLGLNNIPVVLISQSGGGGDSIRWGSQDGYDKIRGKWPEILIGESGKIMKFPVDDFRH